MEGGRERGRKGKNIWPRGLLPWETILFLQGVSPDTPRICGGVRGHARLHCSGIPNMWNKTSVTNSHGLENTAVRVQPLPRYPGTRRALRHKQFSWTCGKESTGKQVGKEAAKAVPTPHRPFVFYHVRTEF